MRARTAAQDLREPGRSLEFGLYRGLNNYLYIYIYIYILYIYIYIYMYIYIYIYVLFVFFLGGGAPYYNFAVKEPKQLPILFFGGAPF